MDKVIFKGKNKHGVGAKVTTTDLGVEIMVDYGRMGVRYLSIDPSTFAKICKAYLKEK